MVVVLGGVAVVLGGVVWGGVELGGARGKNRLGLCREGPPVELS